MKRIILMVLLVSAWSCADCAKEISAETGAISLSMAIDNDVTNVNVGRSGPADEIFSSLTLILEGPDGTVRMPLPDNNLISDLRVGNYTLTITSHPDGFNSPAFEAPEYRGSTNVTVTSATTVTAEIVCKQNNTGMFFTYDPLFAELGWNVVPTVAQGSSSLTYSGDNSESIGYFEAGNVNISLRNGTLPMLIDGEEQQPLVLGTGQLWKVNLSATPSVDGTLNITVEVEVISEATNSESWIVGSTGDEPDLFTITKAEGYFMGSLMMEFPNNDNFFICFNSNDLGTYIDEMTGPGICFALDIYVPKTGSVVLPDGTYVVAEPDKDSFSIRPGDGKDANAITSYVYIGTEDGIERRLSLKAGSVTVTSNGPLQTISGEMTDIEGTKHTIDFTGEFDIFDYTSWIGI